jgi:hypothetical protein
MHTPLSFEMLGRGRIVTTKQPDQIRFAVTHRTHLMIGFETWVGLERLEPQAGATSQFAEQVYTSETQVTREAEVPVADPTATGVRYVATEEYLPEGDCSGVEVRQQNIPTKHAHQTSPNAQPLLT